MEHDLKRLLAYHSIENIGIILMGLGAALMFLHTHIGAGGAGAHRGLSHTINQAMFRRSFPGRWRGPPCDPHAQHGGNGRLIKRMPKTGLLLLGRVAISALPPAQWLHQ